MDTNETATATEGDSPAPGTRHAARGTLPEDASYDPQYFAPLYAAEDRHFWFRARGGVIAAAAARAVRGRPPGYRVLEVGCGTGVALRTLAAACPQGSVVGMDLFAEGLRFARRRVATPLVRGDAHAPPFRVPFAAVGLFDVLEHLPDDRAVLRDLHAMLAPGGALLLTVPASPALWSYFDEASHHCRRYTRADLAAKLAGAGFAVEYLSPFMAALFPVLWAGRRVAALRERLARRPADAGAMAIDELRVVPGLNGLLAAVLGWERLWVARGWRLPMGSSLLAIARKQ